ncbi:hypothetical protein [uncultured Chryseobacterium sp.]|uniref:hypothetical protein n=1 Tax=uncultured Chryseobacterium sp. TaxID=259322 RepID=UPI0025E94618|nr:hypothetical protein [uncultured Chryseobacterium sp.]
METLEKYGIVEAGKDYILFDCESFEEIEAYVELIKNLSSISKGLFSPQNLAVENEGWTGNREHYIAEISFASGNEKYQIRLLCEEWFDFDLILELNYLLSKKGIVKQFLPIRTGDQSLIIVFGDACLKEKLAVENILENADQLIVKKPLNFKSLKIV